MRNNNGIRRTLIFLKLLTVAICNLIYITGYSQTTSNIAQAGWYRIGQNGTTLGGSSGSRAAAHYIIMDKSSGQHQTVEFLAYVHYNKKSTLVVLGNSYYGTSGIPFPKIRIVSAPDTYKGTAVEVYVDPKTNNAETFLIEDNTQSNGWTAVNWQQTSTGNGDQDGVPTGFTGYVIDLKDLVTGFVTKTGSQSNYANGNFCSSGNILLGKKTQTNTAYKLDINGKARANELVVNTSGADFVFDSAYQLLSLNSVRNFIENNHHLPGIPSAIEMETNGLSLGANQTKLLQKIEELTLYLLDQQQKIKEMQTELKALKREKLENDHKNHGEKITLSAVEMSLKRQDDNTNANPSNLNIVKKSQL